jgi:CTP:molybdopterin cytidylyltransferase MocA
MKQFKPLLPLGGRPMIVRIIQMLRTAGIDPILVVAGHRALDLATAIDSQPITMVKNPRYGTGGMLSSVKTGLRKIPRKTDAVILALVDQPMVKSRTLRAMLRAFARTRAPLVIPTFKGRRGHPILLSAKLIKDALALRPDQTLQTLTRRHMPEAVQVEVDDPNILTDLDTPEDYRRAVRRWNESRRSARRSSPGSRIGSR